MNNLKAATWWKRILLFIPCLLAAIGLAVWYFMKPKTVQTPVDVAVGRGGIIEEAIKNSAKTIHELGKEIDKAREGREDMIAELKELSRKVGIRDEEIDRAVADGNFDAITSIIRSEYDTTDREDDNS
jgi:hypothetical protein